MTACIACGADAWEPKWQILCRCRSCGFVRATKLPPAATAADIYTAAYFAGEEYGDYLADRDVHRRNFAARWRDMQRLAGKLTSVFEIGCAYGLFLEYATSQGATAAGIDVCREAVEHAASQLGQRATAGDFLTAPIAAGQYQAFCLWDTIEHLPHPEAVIGRAFELLPPGGWLFLTTGDIGSAVARFRGRSWRMIHPPTHLQYFSRETMRRFLARQGLEVVEIKSVAVYRTLHSVLAGLSVLGKGLSRSVAVRLRKTVPIRTQQRLGAWVNLGDIMGVAARKPSPPLMIADSAKPPVCTSREPLAHALAAVVLTAVVAIAYGSCVTGMVGYADDYWLLWQWREEPGHVLDVWNRAGRFVTAILFSLLWGDANAVGDLWRPRLAAIVGIGMLALGLYATMRRLDYSWWFALAMAGTTTLLPTFAVYAAWATCSGHVFGCLAALAAFAIVDVRWRQRPSWLVPPLMIGGIAAETVALCTYQPAGMFYIVPCLFALASTGMSAWSWVATLRVGIHAAVLIGAMCVAIVIFKSSAGEAEGIDLAERGAMTTDPFLKAGRFVAQPLGQSCVPYWFTNHWSNAARIAIAFFVLGILVPLGTVARLEGSVPNRLLRTAGLLALIPLAYLPHLAVAADFFPYRTRAAIAPAVLFVLLLAAAGGIRYLFREESRRRVVQQVALAAVACAALIAARYHVTHGFLVPSQIEWAVVRSEVLREANRTAQPEQIVFLMPDSSRPLTGRFVYDEFGYLSSSHPWTCRGMTGLAVVDLAPQSLDAFRKARFVEFAAGSPLPQTSGATWTIDARQLNRLAPPSEGAR